MPRGPRFVPAGRMQGANCLITGDPSLRGPATPHGKSSRVCACQTAGGQLWVGRGRRSFSARAAAWVLTLGPQTSETPLQKLHRSPTSFQLGELGEFST